MKKLVLLTLVVAIMAMLTFSVFQVGAGMTGSIAKNSSGTVVSRSSHDSSQLAYGFFKLPPGFTPNIGWNS
jgi:hypothetical protein